jgi:hypothetical protein
MQIYKQLKLIASDVDQFRWLFMRYSTPCARNDETFPFAELAPKVGYMVFHKSSASAAMCNDWVRPFLTTPQKTERVTRSKELLHQLLLIKHHGWQFILTLDESWFYFALEHAHIWLRPEEQPPERPGHMIQGSKMMVTIAWNPLGFHLCETDDCLRPGV